MPLSDSDIRALEPKDNRFRVSIGDALYIEVYPNGGKYFVWRYRFPPGRNGQRRDYQIGPYGRSPSQWTIKKAMEEKERLDTLRRQGEDPRALKFEQKLSMKGDMSMIKKLSSKAQTLLSLKSIIRAAKVPETIIVKRFDWENNSQITIDIINESISGELIVRSSSKEEDTLNYSNAGKYLSLKNINSQNLKTSIDKVFSSYEDCFDDDEVFVQPMIKNVALSGVAFSHDPSTNSPYRIINWTESNDTSLVTSGQGCECWIQLDTCKVTPAKLLPVVELIKELIRLFPEQPIDIEFAITSEKSKCIVWLLQVRRLVTKNICNPKTFNEKLNLIYQSVNINSGENSNLLGSKTIYGVMPDWNPAEIIGIRPKPLALSLYRELVTDSIWALQRNNYGYRNLKDFPLMTNFFGLPYIDVRVSFNSFIPSSVEDGLANSLVEYYINKLVKYPDLHDKIEFNIVFSCYTFDLKERINKLKNHMFSEEQISNIVESLKYLTNQIISSDSKLWESEMKKINYLTHSRELFNNQSEDNLGKVFRLLEDTKLNGTLPFAGIARTAFIAVQLIDSMIYKGIFDKNDKDNFYQSLSTVTRKMVFDKANLNKYEFIEKYGHLRPGTYDITSLRYDEDPDKYFKWDKNNLFKESNKEFKLSKKKTLQLACLLKEHNLNTDSKTFLKFLKQAIEYREYSKFEFTKNVSDILKIIKNYGNKFGFTEYDLAYVDISDLKKIYLDNNNPKELLRKSIELGKRNYLDTVSISLPPLIVSSDDIYGYAQPKYQPSYVTNLNVIAEIAFADPSYNLDGKIICIENADPGYDWIFDSSIVGLITAWGGCNSHMSIRAGELSIPAVIGLGELMYSKISSAIIIQIDCLNHQIKVIE